MKKKTKILAILAIVVLTGALFISYLGQNKEPDNNPTDNPVQGQSIEDALPSLLEESYEKTDAGYVLTESADGVGSECIIDAKGNEMELCLNLEYGEGNSNMKAYYKEQTEAVMVMVSGYLTKLADISGAESATMHYLIRISGDEVCEGEMSLAEARDYEALGVD